MYFYQYESDIVCIVIILLKFAKLHKKWNVITTWFKRSFKNFCMFDYVTLPFERKLYLSLFNHLLFFHRLYIINSLLDCSKYCIWRLFRNRKQTFFDVLATRLVYYKNHIKFEYMLRTLNDYRFNIISNIYTVQGSSSNIFEIHYRNATTKFMIGIFILDILCCMKSVFLS